MRSPGSNDSTVVGFARIPFIRREFWRIPLHQGKFSSAARLRELSPRSMVSTYRWPPSLGRAVSEMPTIRSLGRVGSEFASFRGGVHRQHGEVLPAPTAPPQGGQRKVCRYQCPRRECRERRRKACFLRAQRTENGWPQKDCIRC